MAEPLNATFFAFRKRDKSGVLMGASIAFLICAAVLIAGFIALFWGAISQTIAWYVQLIDALSRNDSAAMANVGAPLGLFAMIPGLLAWTFLFYVLYAAYEAACLRWMIHGETEGFMGLSLGADTWRVYATYWVWFGLYLVGGTALSFVLIALMSVLAIGAAGAGANAGSASMGASILGVTGLFYLAYYVALIFFGVRLAPAAAASIARRKFAFFDAWKVTNGRFWALFGSFFLLFFLFYVFFFAFTIAAFATVIGAALPSLAEAGADPMRTFEIYLQSLLAPQAWIAIGVLHLVGFAVALVFYVALFGVNARAAQAALGEGKIAPAGA